MKEGINVPKRGNRETLAEGFGKSFIRQQYLQPDGTKIDFYIFGSKFIAAIVFALTEKDEVIAVRQFRYGIGDFVLELPGGCRDADESFEEVVRNELLSETGYVPSGVVPIGDSPVFFNPAASENFFYPYLAVGCKKISSPKPEETELISVEVYSIPEWTGKIMHGEVRDAKTIAVTYMALANMGLWC